MEESPFLSHEDDDDKDEDAKKTKKPLLPLAKLLRTEKEDDEEEKHDQALVDLARSLLLGQETNPTSKKETAIDGEEIFEPVELSEEEEVYVNRQIAQDHLNTPVTEGPPQPPVEDFLERVISGDYPEEAYRDTFEENFSVEDIEGGRSPDVAEDYILPPLSDNAESAPRSESLANSLPITASEGIPAQREIHTNPSLAGSEEETKAVPHYRKESSDKKEQSRRDQRPSVVAGGLASYLIGKQRGIKHEKLSEERHRKQLEGKVKSMEENLTVKENSLQELSEKKLKTQNFAEQLKASSLEMNKPDISRRKEKVERLGGLVIAAGSEHRQSKANTKPDIRPDQVATIGRAQLLQLSEGIKVEGASLKTMYENHLFGEGALRRLVSEHLKGKDIAPLMRREILERQIDFERDPMLRDRNRLPVEQANVFERTLGGSKAPESIQASIAKGASAQKENSYSPPTNEIAGNGKTVKVSVASSLIAVTILLIAGLIVYLIAS